MTPTKTTTPEEWLMARRELLIKEKALTHEMDAISEARRALPRIKIDKDYVFETEDGETTLSALFGEHSQLIVYHFMLVLNGMLAARAVHSGLIVSMVWSRI